MFRAIKLYFTDRPYYYQWKNYMKIQSGFRKKLKKLSKKFCPWSGYYMHEVVITMLEFYHKVYESGYCCWSEDSRREKISKQITETLDYANSLDLMDSLDCEELVNIARKDPSFIQYKDTWEEKWGTKVTEKNEGYIAYDFLEQYYTSKMYENIGKYIWEWSD